MKTESLKPLSWLLMLTLFVGIAPAMAQEGRLVVSVGDTIGGTTLGGISSPSISGNGEIVFFGWGTRADGTHDEAIFSSTRGRLVGAGDTVGGILLDYAYDPAINEAGHLVFVGSWSGNGTYQSGIFSLTENRLLAGTGDVIGGFTLSHAWLPAINGLGDMIFMANGESADGSVHGIFSQTEVLLTTSSDAGGFALIDHPVIDGAGNVFFYGHMYLIEKGTSPHRIYCLQDGAAAAAVVAAGDTVAGLTLDRMELPAVNDAGSLIFQAHGYRSPDDLSGTTGIFDLASDRLLVAVGDTVDGVTLEVVGDPMAKFGAAPAVNNRADVVFLGGRSFFKGSPYPATYGIFLLPGVEPTPEELIGDLVTDVAVINLDSGIVDSLDAKLTNVTAAFTAENADLRQDAVNKLEAFISSVEAQSGKKISVEDAAYLTGAATKIIEKAKK